MRSVPVHPRALGAPGEHLIAPPRSRQQLRVDIGLADRDQRPVARHAPGPRRQRRREPVQHVGELLIGPCAAYVGAEPQTPPAQQPAVLRQQHAALGAGLRDQRVVVSVVGIGAVEADQAQAPRHRAEMYVQDEPGRGQALRAGDGQHLNEVAAHGPVRGRGRLAVDEQAADLRQRHAE
jgi:hypothetical protein